MRRLFIATAGIILAAGGCRFDEGGMGFGTDDAGGGADAPMSIDAGGGAIDAPPGSPDAPPGSPDAAPVDAAVPDAVPCDWPYSPTHVDPCDPHPASSAALTFGKAGRWVYNTTTAVLTDPDDMDSTPANSVVGDVRVIWVDGFDLAADADLRVIGSQPLVVVSDGAVVVAGDLSVGSFFDEGNGVYRAGAGANPAVCPASPPNPGLTCAQHGGSGGGGGALGADGGDGGEGGDGHTCPGGSDGLPGGAGGDAVAMTPATLRGGCGGRDGAANDGNAGDRGIAGPGGGAIHLMARTGVTVSGTINAGGAGGSGGIDNRAGGGGGGSGGMIGLEGDTVTITGTAQLAANGGGGGGGCDGAVASRGGDGALSTTAAGGGTEQGNGGPGGNGGVLAQPAGQPGTLGSRGGGGGGGGVGFILLYSPNTPTVMGGALTSPAPAVP